MSHYTSGIGISYKFSYKDSLYGGNPGVCENSNAHIFISSLWIHLKLEMWSILCIYLMSGPLLCSYTTFPGLSFLLPDFEGFESSNSSQMCKSS